MDKESCMSNMRKQFENMKAEDFAEVWNKYDADGNGFIEGRELENFFTDFVMRNRDSSAAAISPTMLEEMIKQHMCAYDEDEDGRIGMSELAEILNQEENFKLILRTQDAKRSRKDFDEIWCKYDSDQNGYIDSAELKLFLRDLLPDSKVCDASLDKYAAALLKMLDSNDDKKLERQEMEKFFAVTD
ncbi:calbindin-32-like [Acanthaster planci]|uniref:Calbindin-32-like n=1 Tax=Acanthaster planci TaxID=133434 RepID=A0A8B7XQV1_ACAPL|nr:calbindin-32-like [Acanthaster planci]